MKRDVSLFITMPHSRDVKAYSCASLAGLSYRLGKIGLGDTANLAGLELAAMANVSLLPRGRQYALNTAIAKGHTHILMLDDDMTYPPDVVEVLISREKPIIGVNYLKKKMGAEEFTAINDKGQSISSKGKFGIEQVFGIGLGAVLVELDAIKNIKAPHFEVRYHSENQEYMGEDFYFCAKMQNAGIPIFVDHDVSQYIGHVGDFVFKHHDYSTIEYEKRRKEQENGVSKDKISSGN